MLGRLAVPAIAVTLLAVQAAAAPVDEVIEQLVTDAGAANLELAELTYDRASRSEDFRVLPNRPQLSIVPIQFTPPGSGASIIFGKNVTAAAPGSAQGLYLVVSDVEAARRIEEFLADGEA